MNQITPTPKYDQLIASVKSTLKQGLVAAKRALEYQRVKTYWTIGAQIDRYLKKYAPDIRFTEGLYKQISADIKRELDIDMKVKTLRAVVLFARRYPKFPAKTTLTFTHYLALQRISDPQVRLKLEEEASAKNISSTELRNRIREIKIERQKPQKTVRRLDVKRGRPYLYQVKSFRRLGGASERRIDCGFNIDIPCGNICRQKELRVVRVDKKDGQYRACRFKGDASQRYTYAAEITRVVDGDTVDVHIDVGFSIWISERLRLKGINAPERGTMKGKAAQKFLEKLFARQKRVIIRTNKAGVYGRWIADIFFLKGSDNPMKIAEEGILVNQLLLDQGLAEIYAGG